MTSNGESRAKAIFSRVLDVPPEERAEILERECGADTALRELVASLLDHDLAVTGGDFLDPPAAIRSAAARARERSEDDDVSPLRPGDEIGRYRVLREIGAGGFGVVWEAEQTAPISRQVALKLIKPGMDTREVLRRFRAEREALSRMDHPGIARVMDAGQTPDGRPFFAMEFIDGLPLLDYFEEVEADLATRLRCFVSVCRALEHAHQKGVIHRDVKPSNVLVSLSRGEPQVKVIDFGVAKAMGERGASDSSVTLMGQIVGTPFYMSPEQTHGGRRAVDTRSDIYSLGVLLFEILTGTTPFSPIYEEGGGLSDIVEAIRERPAERPSRSLSRTQGPAGFVKRHYRGRIESLRKMVAGDLDWIVSRCLEKDVMRRYAAAGDLADDVERYLGQEPVAARPPSFPYRARKFLSRHRTGVALSTFVICVVLGTLVTVFLWTREKNEELKRANAELTASNVALDEGRAALSSALGDVQRLSDLRTLSTLEGRADEEFWPALPAKTDDMRAWIAEAEELLGRAEGHRRLFESLRDGALPVLNGEPGDLFVERGLGFRTNYEAWLFRVLGSFNERIETFRSESGPLASVRKRAAFAGTLVQRTVIDYADAWRAVQQAVDAGDRYPRLAEHGLPPQVGLIPLGPDPDSGLQEFLHLASHRGPIPVRGADGRLVYEEKTGIILVLVPGGDDWLGAQAKAPSERNFDPRALRREGPVREVSCDAFFIGKHEMTQGQWVNAEGSNPSEFAAGSRWDGKVVSFREPIEHVSWVTCQRALKKLDLAFPPEREWEYAARAGSDDPWYTGPQKTSLEGAANLADRAAARAYINNLAVEDWMDDGAGGHTVVGRYRPNAFGLHDMMGNVAEWSATIARIKVNRNANAKNKPVEMDGRRIFRGGAYLDLSFGVRVSGRGVAMPEDANGLRGVRPFRRIRRSRGQDSHD